MLSTKHLLLLVFSQASLLWKVNSQGVLCLGDCDDPGNTFSRAIPQECPVGSCDGTGVLQHHRGDETKGVTSCSDASTETTFANSFSRCFDGGFLGCTTERQLESVYFSVTDFELSADQQIISAEPITVVVDVNIYKGGSDGCDTTENVQALWGQDPEVSIQLPITSGAGVQQLTVPVPVFVRFTPSDSLLVEINVPSLVLKARFILSDTNMEDCSLSYLQSSLNSNNEGCAKVDAGPFPTSGTVIGKPFSNYVISVNTKEAPAPTPFPSSSPSISATPTAAPVEPPVMPSGRPVPAPPNTCFSGCDIVTLFGVGETTMDQVRVGDYLKTAAGHFTRVFSLAHYQPDAEAEFIQIYTTDDTDEKPLEMTSDHLIFVNGTAIRASRVRVGDSLVGSGQQQQIVTKLTKIKKRGVYAPLTESGDLLVNGIHVSSYVGILDMAVWNQHVLGHLLFSPVRIFCHWQPDSCHREVHDQTGFSNLYSWLIWLVVWIGRAGTLVSFLASAMAAPFLVAAWILEQVVCRNHAIATCTAAFASTAVCGFMARPTRFSHPVKTTKLA